MKKIATWLSGALIVLIVVSVAFRKPLIQKIHIDLPSRAEWKEIREVAMEKQDAESDKGYYTFPYYEIDPANEYHFTWSFPENDEPPKYFHIHANWGDLESNWGFRRVDLSDGVTSFIVKASELDGSYDEDWNSRGKCLLRMIVTFVDDITTDGEIISTDVHFIANYCTKEFLHDMDGSFDQGGGVLAIE